MEKVQRLCVPLLAVVLLLGCASLNKYKQADSYKQQIQSLALLPLVVGDDDGRIEMLGSAEFQEFVAFFKNRFYDDFQKEILLVGAIGLKLPGRDFSINAYNGMDLLAVARELDVDAVLGVNLTLYNEVKPSQKGAQIAAAVVTSLFLGGYVTERQIVGYDTHYAYLGIEKVDEALSFKFSGKAFPTIEEQRQFFVDALIGYLDRSFPLSTDYVPAYKE
jgi:hypothetical protein